MESDVDGACLSGCERGAGAVLVVDPVGELRIADDAYVSDRGRRRAVVEDLDPVLVGPA